MLAAAFASWIEHLPERAFDEPFLNLLRAQGFYDIHFTHGAYEFGKDFIAKRNEPLPTQYGFQAKSGDIAGGAWDAILAQLLELSAGTPTHPSYAPELPRKSVLVVTGRLIGKAVVGPSQFKDMLHQLGRGEFEVWDIDVLKELVEGSSRFPVVPVAALLPSLGLLESSIPNERDLEHCLAALVPAPGASIEQFRRAFVDNWLVVSRLLDKGYTFLSLFAALNGVRVGAARAHTHRGEGQELLAHALDSYVVLGHNNLEPLLATPRDQDAWIEWVGGASGIVNYPIACTRVLEFLGLAALHRDHQGRVDEARELAELAAVIVESQPGAAHPISDRSASVYPAVLAALVRFGHQSVASRLLRSTTKWVCDRYEASNFGLASTYSTPEEEVRTLLAAPFEFAELSERRDSLLFVALADASYTLVPDDFADILNEFLAVRIIPTGLHAEDSAAAYLVGGGATRGLVNIRYPDTVTTAPLAHHAMQPGPRTLELACGPVGPLAISCIVRDRLFTDVLERCRKTTRTIQN